MTNQELVNRLAMEVMSWVEEDGAWIGANGEPMAKTRIGGYEGQYWNPLTDWNHWRQVEKRVLENEDLFGAFKRSFMDSDTVHPYLLNDNIYLYMKADLPTRCRALLTALDSLKQA